MKRGMLDKIKHVLSEIWKDFRNPGPVQNNCCGYELSPDTSYLQPQPVRIRKAANTFKNLK